MQEERSKRTPKPKTIFSPEAYDEAQLIHRLTKKLKKEEKEEKTKLRFKEGNNRCRNRVADSNNINIWDRYRSVVIKKYLRDISRDLHYIQVYSNDHNVDTGNSARRTNHMIHEIEKCQDRITNAKKNIVEVFRLMAHINEDHKQWPELAEEVDDDGLVDLEHIYCSKCGLEDDEGNDILFCDRTVSFFSFLLIFL